MQFKQSLKQEIVDDHLKSHNGEFAPHDFLKAAEKKRHPAHGYFTWDDTKASHEYRLWEARKFVSGLRIEVPANTVAAKPFRLSVVVNTKEVSMPALVSNKRGTYFRSANKEGVSLLMEEAAIELEQWLYRHGDLVGLHVSVVESVKKLAAALRSKVETEAA